MGVLDSLRVQRQLPETSDHSWMERKRMWACSYRLILTRQEKKDSKLAHCSLIG
ncbi:unnamed protein product [Gulo gulo]|uniref:Uncharacterized protein n=1 Tax=Gulo gulo TaxID=48420 RepID=A0A9X9M7Y2_GULGU|nr:unnamed protein product [Gulo gulo]